MLIFRFSGGLGEWGLDGWEYINGDAGYAAYRKLYKDTGLFQYKVIGRFHDITARDFLEAQVSGETIDEAEHMWCSFELRG